MITMGNIDAHIKRIKELEDVIAKDESNSFLIKVLSDIRIATGVNEKPMLSELAATIQDQYTGMKAALIEAANIFDHYYDLHAAKNPPDMVKALANKAHADKFRKAAGITDKDQQQSYQWHSPFNILPKKPGIKDYEYIDCEIITKDGKFKRPWNCEHLCFDDEDYDDHFCSWNEVYFWRSLEPCETINPLDLPELSPPMIIDEGENKCEKITKE